MNPFFREARVVDDERFDARQPPIKFEREPTEKLRAAEIENDFTTRLALQEEIKSLPFGAVWDFYCESKGVPVGDAWLAEVKRYEKDVLANR